MQLPFQNLNFFLFRMYSSMQQSGMDGSPNRKRNKIPTAGALNSKTLAEENLKGFKLKNLQKESDLPLRVNQA